MKERKMSSYKNLDRSPEELAREKADNEDFERRKKLPANAPGRVYMSHPEFSHDELLKMEGWHLEALRDGIEKKDKEKKLQQEAEEKYGLEMASALEKAGLNLEDLKFYALKKVARGERAKLGLARFDELYPAEQRRADSVESAMKKLEEEDEDAWNYVDEALNQEVVEAHNWVVRKAKEQKPAA